MVALVPLGLVGSLLVQREPLALKTHSVHPVCATSVPALGEFGAGCAGWLFGVPLVLGGSLLDSSPRGPILALPLLLLDRSDWALYWAGDFGDIASLAGCRVSPSC